jgi:hypothetical protein
MFALTLGNKFSGRSVFQDKHCHENVNSLRVFKKNKSLKNLWFEEMGEVGEVDEVGDVGDVGEVGEVGEVGQAGPGRAV